MRVRERERLGEQVRRRERERQAMERSERGDKEMELESESLGDLRRGGERREGKARERTCEHDF